MSVKDQRRSHALLALHYDFSANNVKMVMR